MDNILVVEDAPNFLRWVATAITRDFPACQVRMAATARQAESEIATAAPSAVVLDLALPRDSGSEMPSINAGMELLGRLARGSRTIPTIVMSSHSAGEACLAAGASEFISKSSPTVLDDLLTALQAVVPRGDEGGQR
ncbi:MAG: hypothetical protein CO096_25985 [Armatimonadetes bacterium CG_4_9_14_3_um_filter_66_14]|nr:MAG: hypothetical protein CO096_25985 [Armatimonadetes bacterium CG_4_9_14_3_um_filter_66_14]